MSEDKSAAEIAAIRDCLLELEAMTEDYLRSRGLRGSSDPLPAHQSDGEGSQERD